MLNKRCILIKCIAAIAIPSQTGGKQADDGCLNHCVLIADATLGTIFIRIHTYDIGGKSTTANFRAQFKHYNSHYSRMSLDLKL